jgi:hypothetical protein
MSTYAWAIRPNGLVSHSGHQGHGGLSTALEVLLDVCETVAFSYRLRTAGNGARAAGAARRGLSPSARSPHIH